MSVRIYKPSLLSRRTLLTSPYLHNPAPDLALQRPFVSTPTSATDPPASITASRVLPYPALSIFNIIADIPSYPAFLPYVSSAKTLSSSARPDSTHHKTWPASASLSIGFRDAINETFTSRVYCVPPVPHRGRAGVGFVEAVSGSEAPPPAFTADEDVGHYDLDAQQADQIADTAEGPLAYLRTRWTVHAYPHKPSPAGAEATHDVDLEKQGKSATEMTNVSLAVEYRFKNAVYEMMSRAATPKIADSMIEAFEKRCRELLAHEVAR